MGRPYVGLTPHKLKILSMLAEGKTAEEVGQELWLSNRTIKAHMVFVRSCLGARNTVHAVHIAHNLGFLPLVEDEEEAAS